MTAAKTTSSNVARTATSRLETDREVEVKQSGVGLIRADSVSVKQAALGVVLARGGVSVIQGGGRSFLAGGKLRIQKGGGGLFLAAGDAEIQQGGVGTLVALGGTRFEQGGAMLAVARDVEAGSGSTIGIAIAPRMTISPGARVMAGTREVVIGGVVAGAVASVVMLVARRILER